MTYQEAEEYILEIPKFSKKTGQEHVSECLKRLGNPQNTLYIIHVAGTNGKGSVSNYMDSVLREAGVCTGLFTSPHLVTMRERMRVNGEWITEETFLKLFLRVKKVVTQMEDEGFFHLSFFEWIFVMAIIFFKESQTEVCILETGLGGRLDATNFVQSQASVITSVSYDHMQFLGDSLEQIAREKAGIIKHGKPCFSTWQREEVTKVLEEVTNQRQSELHRLEEADIKEYRESEEGLDFYLGESGENYSIQTKAYYQMENAALSILVLRHLFPKIPQEVIKKGLKKTLWEGRMESVSRNILIDGAHNEDAIEKFCMTVKKFYQTQKKKLLFAVADDKDYIKMIQCLCGSNQFDEVMVTQIYGVRAASVEEVFNLFQRNTTAKIWIEQDLEKAYKKMRQRLGENEILFCVGSLYLVGSIKTLEQREEG